MISFTLSGSRTKLKQGKAVAKANGKAWYKAIPGWVWLALHIWSGSMRQPQMRLIENHSITEEVLLTWITQL